MNKCKDAGRRQSAALALFRPRSASESYRVILIVRASVVLSASALTGSPPFTRVAATYSGALARILACGSRRRTMPALTVNRLAAHNAAQGYAPKIWGQMPARIKVLYITTLHRTGGWLAEAFGADSATEILLEEAVGVTAGLARLRDEVFDAVLISHEPEVLDAVELIEGLRAGGNDEPMIVLGAAPAADMSALCYEVGADAYCCVDETTTRSLLWTFARAIERYQLIREHRRLVQTDQQRLAHEHQEAERLLRSKGRSWLNSNPLTLIGGLQTADCGLQTPKTPNPNSAFRIPT